MTDPNSGTRKRRYLLSRQKKLARPDMNVQPTNLIYVGGRFGYVCNHELIFHGKGHEEDLYKCIYCGTITTLTQNEKYKEKLKSCKATQRYYKKIHTKIPIEPPKVI